MRRHQVSEQSSFLILFIIMAVMVMASAVAGVWGGMQATFKAIELRCIEIERFSIDGRHYKCWPKTKGIEERESD